MTEDGRSRRRRTFDDADRTARARIRDAAIARFAAQGVAATNLKDIAADAGVSTPLVIHHFGSKEGLRAACDQYIASWIRERKTASMTAGKDLDPFRALRDALDGTPVIAYLARTIADGSPHVDQLIDEMVEDSLTYLAEGVEKGLIKPAENLREQASLICVWLLGALVLHKHVKRLLGIDLIEGDPHSLIKWMRINLEVLAKGVIAEDFYDTWRDALQAAEAQTAAERGDDADRETP
ncbi:TetR/AcrR family transcriptional regulator [Thermobispora bispora]|uniref:TetR/AcrR family transcriptional regulator n=1 Tax=Thermobispora bispora TaxID=2006 RepID=UPI0019815E00|nr:TetR family transcriptional regulator [Thermobispora bispora]QSI49466.1 TetR/AcrR family transcriptional regulator [Thermobispora bispora]